MILYPAIDIRDGHAVRLVEGIPSETPFYLVHSFVVRPAAEDTLGTAEYGERFACAA